MDRKKGRKVSQVFLIVCVFSFLAWVMVLTLLLPKETVSYYENRSLEEKPELTVEGIVDGSYFSGMERYILDHSAKRTELLKINTFLDLYVFDRITVSDVVVTEDVLLPYLEYAEADEQTISQQAVQMADRLAFYRDQCEAYGAKFYYVAVPCQYVLFEDRYPSYLNNRSEYTRLSSQALFAALEERQVSYIDMLRVFRDMDVDLEVASAVDNHFSIYGAYETYRRLMQQINEDMGLELEILEEGEYTITEVQNHYLGSRARKLFDLWPSGESLYMLQPNEQIPFTRYDWDGEVPGASRVYSVPDDPGDMVLYKLYMGGDVSHTVIDTDREELPSILIYGDSFTNPVECIIWTSFDTMESLDFRHYSKMTLSEFIDEKQPDIVVCIRDYEALLSMDGNGQ